MKVCLACGGTGGHIYPALAIAEKFPHNFFIGGSRLEKTLVPQAGWKFYEIPASAKELGKIFQGFREALKIIAQEKPELVIATGGYATAPVVLAAKLLGKKIYLQEQNILPGKVNRVLSLLAEKVFVAFAGAARYLPRGKAVITGNPVRAEVSAVKYSPSSAKVLAFGGSLSAETINNTVNELKKSRADILHLDGTNYCNDMAAVYGQSRFCICRAGATTLSELAAMGMPSILIPYPRAADDHQTINARYFAERGAAVLIADKDLTAETLTSAMAQIDDPETLQKMSTAAKALGLPDAAEKIRKYIQPSN